MTFSRRSAVDVALQGAGMPKQMNVLRSLAAASGIALLCTVVAMFAFSEEKAIVQAGVLRRAHVLQRQVLRAGLMTVVQVRYSHLRELIASERSTDLSRRLFQPALNPAVTYPL
jgi:hypothetical protein